LYRLCTGRSKRGNLARSADERQARSGWIPSENARLSRRVARDVLFVGDEPLASQWAPASGTSRLAGQNRGAEGACPRRGSSSLRAWNEVTYFDCKRFRFRFWYPQGCLALGLVGAGFAATRRSGRGRVRDGLMSPRGAITSGARA